MYNLIEKIFGKVAANKVRMKLGETQRNPRMKQIVLFVNNLFKKFDATDDVWMKGVLLAAPLINLFIFT